MTEQQLGQWVVALESGTYKQVQFEFVVEHIDGTCEHCCLGVLSEVLGIYRFGSLKYPFTVLPPSRQLICMDLNDGMSIDQYAMVIADLKGAAEYYITEV